MKTILKFFLKHYLRFFVRLSLLVNRPLIIAVAGSINKPFVKEAIKASLLGEGWRVSANAKNFNTEIGLPLAILGLKSGYNSYRAWLPAILEAPKRIFRHGRTDILVLGYGTSDPGDMKALLAVARPTVAVITDLTQRYKEGFSDLEQLMAEYELLVEALPANGLAVLNNDKRPIRELALRTGRPKKTFSIEEESDFRALNIVKTPAGTGFEILAGSGERETRQLERHGEHHVYASLIALIVKNYANEKLKKPAKGRP